MEDYRNHMPIGYAGKNFTGNNLDGKEERNAGKQNVINYGPERFRRGVLS